MKYILYIAIVIVAFSGCGGQKGVPTNPPAPTALTLEEWKKLPIPEKYDEGTFERLRMGNPALQTNEGWHDYMAREIMPERRKDIPGTPGVLPSNVK